MGDLSRGEQAADPRSLVAQERRIQALELRKARYSYRRIAKALDVDVHTAYDDVQAELKRLRLESQEQAEELRTLEVEALDDLHRSLWHRAQGYRLEGEGRDATRVPLDARDQDSAVDRVVKISERRAKLLGLDAPVEMHGTFRGYDLSKLSEDELATLEALTVKMTSTDEPAAPAEEATADA